MQISLKNIYKLYLILLPFQLLSFLRAFKNLFSSAASIGNDFFLMALGLLLLFISFEGKLNLKKDSIVMQSIVLVLSLLGISFVTSLILFYPLGTLYGENSITASFAQNIYLIVTGLTFLFNHYLFRAITRQEIEKILDGLCILMIILGVIQIAIIMGAPVIGTIYDQIDLFSILPDSDYMIRMNRICLLSSEPSGIGQIVCILLLPYVLGKLINLEKRAGKYGFFAAALVIISFFSLSSTVFVALLLNFLIYIILKSSTRRGATFLLSVGGIALVLLLFWNAYLADTYVGQQIQYLLLEKTTDTNNLSTSYRYSTVINDFFCFLRYPLTGIGNGNQGFLYNQTMNRSFIGNELRTNYQTVRAMSGAMGVVAGGPFTPAFISGYGLAGVFLLIRFLKVCKSKIDKFPERIGSFKYMYYIGGLTFLITAIVSGGLDGNYLVLFVCSLPMLTDTEAMSRKADSHE